MQVRQNGECQTDKLLKSARCDHCNRKLEWHRGEVASGGNSYGSDAVGKPGYYAVCCEVLYQAYDIPPPPPRSFTYIISAASPVDKKFLPPGSIGKDRADWQPKFKGIVT